ncbi:hypothetical protein HFO42_23950 [Rhizobium leguminosarum]|uniref:Uncharacterized protein n=1 Tax=Rhizobium leguminosarum TaxID=384 RepID=A0AAJ1ABJ1_RHILE|nr:hypothetical protein [Rhizobium leguminosarum]MBY5536272.1 hypothetical protein [Rhizobium leguminosarum]MBY5597589.1 hypothetical protein [Rhizobium leguminosarum]MBY5617628.1 hypothetical protein [Rhizobium leguminosarum]MBY5631129.1 hypothetical protein [Rhizobium leguminosarum]MBY5713694.1 hypothetical protein [Rhizobium leguminosarum]
MNSNIDAWAKSLAKQLVSENAPEEFLFFDELVEAERDPKAANKDSYMGFGGSDAVMVIMTGALFDIAKYVAAFVWSNGRDAAGELVKNCSESTQKVLSEKFDRWMKSFEPKDASVETPVADKPPIMLPAPEIQRLNNEIDGLKSIKKLSDRNVDSVRRLIARFGEA